MAANSLINCKPRTRMRNMRKRQKRVEKFRMQAMMGNIGTQDRMANIGMQARIGNIGMQDRMANTGMQARVGNIGMQGRNPSELGVLSPASLTFRNSVIDRFGPVPPIQGSLNSMIQTMSGTNNEESGVRPTDMNPPQSCDGNQPSNVCNQSSGLNIDVEEDCDISFPGLIIFKGIGKQYKGINFLKKSFINSQYGPLTVTKIRSGNMSKASAWACGKCLVVGQGLTGEEAEHEAGYKLLRKLRKTNYYLEAKGTYIPMKKFPDCVRHVDPSLSHIYKVVFLQTLDGPEFPHTIEGAVDYVSSFDELISYIINYGQSGSKADLFILNIDKSQRTAVYQACRQIGMKGRPVVGCSDRGVVADYMEDCRQVFEDLKKCGGETIKYRLYPPSGDDEIIDLTDEKEKSHVEQEGTAPEQTASEEQEDHVISPWIAQNLIIMETFNEISWLESPKEIIFQSVKSCPALEEFIIEKKTDRVSKMITAEALIDKQVVGSATSYIEKLANERAAEDALKNLRKHCPSIEVKQDYLGARRTMLPPCILNRFKSKNNIFRVVRSNEVNNEYEVNQLFKHFWNTPFEDLFFLEDFAPNERELIYKMSKNHGLRARLFGNKCVCVYKNKTPREVFKQLMHTKSKENEKYKLHLPPAKPKPPVATTSQTLNETRETKIKGLFDFKQTGKTVKNQFSSSNIFDLASHTVSQGGPFNSGLLNLNESATDRSGNTEETMGNLQVNQTDPSQIPGVPLWERRKYSSYPEKRSYSEAGLDDGTKSEYKSPKMSFNNEHFIQQRYPTGERSGCRETGPDSSACLDKSSNLIESNSRVESVDPICRQQKDQFWAQHFKNVYDQWPKAKDYFQSNVNDDIDLCNKDSQSLQPRQFVNKLFDLPSVYNARTNSEISEQNYSRSSVSESDKIRHSDNMDKLKNNEKKGQFGQVEVNESNVSGAVFRGSGWKESDKQKLQECNNEKYSSLGQPDIFDTPDGTPLLHSSQMEEQPWASPSGGWDIEPKDYAFDEGPGRGEPKKVEQQKHKDLNSSVRPSNHKVPTPPPPPTLDREDFERLFQESHKTFSNLFDMGPGRKSDTCTLAQETSGKNKNQSYDRGNSSRFLDSTLREHSEQQTHTYWKDNIKRAYDQRQPETKRKSKSNFSTHQNVNRSQGPQNSRFHSNRNRSRDRRETNRRTNYRRSPDRRERKREQDLDRNTNRGKERRVTDRSGRY